jgi:hypothetical protein
MHGMSASQGLVVGAAIPDFIVAALVDALAGASLQARCTS